MEADGLTYFPAPLIVVKVHAQGLNWWMSQGPPPTMSVGCWSLLDRPDWRTYAQPRGGAHFIYKAAPGLMYPTVEFDTFIDTHTYWTKMPPDKSKTWLDRREPAEIDWFPDPTPLRDLALDMKRTLLAGQ